MKLRLMSQKRLCLSGVDPGWAQVLAAVPVLLSEPQPPSVRERLLPNPSNDDKLNREWRELITPELEALWRTNYEVMAGDLSRAESDADEEDCVRLVFPQNHAAAWISAINQARLTLGARWDVTEEDMNRPLARLKATERDQALMLIHLLAFAEELFIEAQEI